MKIAIIVNGQPRFRNSLDHIIHNVTGYTEVHWFFYLWSNSSQSRHGNNLVPYVWQSVADTETARRLIEPRLPTNHFLGGIKVEQQPPKPPAEFKFLNSNLPLYYQFLSLKRVGQMLKDYEDINGKFDIACRTRVDEYFGKPMIDLQQVKNQLQQDPSIIFTANTNMHFNGHFGMNDHSAITSSDNLYLYSRMVDFAEELVATNPGVEIPEAVLCAHLLNNKINIVKSHPLVWYPITYNYWDRFDYTTV